MANWKKLAVSGSATAFPQLKVDTSITASIFSGSQFIGALTGTASYATNADTAISSSYALSASYAPGSDTSISASYALSSSYALNASTADSSTSASYALSSSYASNASTADSSTSASYALSGSYALNASTADSATSASYALSSSYSLNASTADSSTSASYALSSSYSSFALTASYVIDKTIVTGSNATFVQSTPATTWVFNHMLNDQFPVFQVFNASNQVIIPASITADNNITATITFSVPTAGTAIASIGGFTGSAPTVFSASYAETASFASTASYAETAQTASYVLNAVSASRATSAANADNATSASFAATGNGTFSGSFSGSFQGDGSGLTNIPASGITGLNLSRIASGSVTASISPDLGFTVNTNSKITGSLIVTDFVKTNLIKGTGSLFLQPNENDARQIEIYNTSIQDTHIIATGGLTFIGNDTNYLKVDNPAGIITLSGVDSVNITASALNISNNTTITGSLVATGANSSLTGSFTGSFAGNFVGTSNLPDLTQGTGISTFTYDGSTTATVAVSGASDLSATTLPKWTGDAFANSSITDAANVTINNNGGVLVQAGGLYVTGASTFHNNVVMQANLTVNGTASFQNVENLAVKDQFILLNSGSSTFQDSGIVINTGNSANSGSAFFLETAGTTTGTSALNGRFAVASGVLPDATTATAAEYAVTALITGSAPGASVPQFGGTGLGQGNMWVNTDTDELFIYF